MTQDPPADSGARPIDVRSSSGIAVFTATTFLSAMLLFSVQPMFAKMVLPLLGGAPSVVGRGAAVFPGRAARGLRLRASLVRYVPARITGFVHLAVSAAALLALPIAIPAGWTSPPPGDAYLWQLALFTVAIGLPFVAVSANAPLIQAWYAQHRAALERRIPTFSMPPRTSAASSALLGYPFLFEPVFGLKTLGARLDDRLRRSAGRARRLLHDRPALRRPRCRWMALKPTAGPRAPSRMAVTRASWVGLAFVPSALLTAFTTHVATDVASAP